MPLTKGGVFRFQAVQFVFTETALYTGLVIKRAFGKMSQILLQ